MTDIEREEAIRDLATSQDHEVDADAKVSEGDNNGAYVQAWVWVSFVDTPLDKELE